MGEPIRAIDLADDLGVDATTFRGWLRELAARGHPVTAGHEPWARWTFTADEAAAVTDLFESDFERANVVVRLLGHEERVVYLREIKTFLSSIDDLLAASWSQAPGLPVDYPGAQIRRLRMGSPVDLQIIFPQIVGAGVLGGFLTYFLKLIGAAADVQRAEAAADDADTNRMRAETEQFRAETERRRQVVDAAESQARQRNWDAQTREIEARLGPRYEDRTGLISPADVLGLREPTRPPEVENALLVIERGSVKVQWVVISWGKRRRRVARRQRHQ